MPSIRSLLATLALLPALCAAQTLALTFDDGLDPAKTPAAAQWNRQILDSLQDAAVPAMVFPALVRIGGEPGRQLIVQWAQRGHYIGNHTASHRSLAAPDMGLPAFEADVQKADEALRTLDRFVPMLRFPYLKEGDTQEKRDGMRAWMQAHHYRTAAVSVDASDWYYNQAYTGWLAEGQPQQAAQVQAAYVAHLLDRASYYDQLARQVLGYSPPHVLLLHTNQLNAAAMGQVIAAFRQQGWRFVSPMRAFADPLYQRAPEVLPAGESIVWSLAKAAGVAGLRYPAEDSVYEAPLLEAQALLPPALRQAAP